MPTSYGGNDDLAQLRSKALERHGADTVWHFRKDFYVFSNFHPLREPYYVTVFDPESGESDGIWYPSSEQAFMAAKTLKLHIRRRISQMRTPAEAKRYCRSNEFKQHYQRQDFYEMHSRLGRKLCVHFMCDILRQKFADPQLRKALLDTGSAHIMEGNTWGDDFWGKIVNSSGELVGENNLGEILMNLRSEFRREVATQARQQKEENQFKFQMADFPDFPVLGQSQAMNSSVLVQGATFSSPTEPFFEESACEFASIALRECSEQLDGSQKAAELKPEPLMREMAANTTQRRRWNRGTALPNDSKTGVTGALVDTSDGDKKTGSAGLPASLHDDSFSSLCGKQPLEEVPGLRSPAIADKEVRRLLKALREIEELELKLEVAAKAGGCLRRNQMQKIAKKQEYLDKLKELAIPVSVYGGS